MRVPRRRDALLGHLRERDVAAVVYYPTLIHQQPLYSKLGYKDYLPMAEQLSGEVLSLPVHPSLTDNELESIIAAVDSYFEGEL